MAGAIPEWPLQDRNFFLDKEFFLCLNFRKIIKREFDGQALDHEEFWLVVLFLLLLRRGLPIGQDDLDQKS
jgi:hypothetical protein